MYEKVKGIVSTANYTTVIQWPVCLICSHIDEGLGEASSEPLLPIPKCSLQRIFRFLDAFFHNKWHCSQYTNICIWR